MTTGGLGDTPVMRQYAALKAAHGEALLLFRLGDFYEIFGPDAEAASGILGITLTRRRTAKEDDPGVPMCGVPYHAAESYIGKLLAAGCKVALAEQVETPAQAKARGGSNALMQREVVRVLTPGTLTEEAYLQPGQQRVLAALVPAQGKEGGSVAGGLAWLDLASGEVGVRAVAAETQAAALHSLPIAELLVAEEPDAAWLGPLPRRTWSVQPQVFAKATAEAAVQQAYGVRDVAGLGVPQGACVQALGAVLGYAVLTQLGKLPALQRPVVVRNQMRLGLDAATRSNLELIISLQGERGQSLAGVLDVCVTGPGSRLLTRWVAEPLADVAGIEARQAVVRALVAQPGVRQQVRQLLGQTQDVARCANRIVLGRGSPRDFGALRNTGARLPEFLKSLQPLMTLPLVQKLAQGLDEAAPLTNQLAAALRPDPLPIVVRDGGFIADGFDAALEEQRRLQRDGQKLLEELTAREQAASGVSLKLQSNTVWGWFWDISKAELAKLETRGQALPAHLVHRQTTTNAQRFVSAELMQLERALAGAADAAQAREEAILNELAQAVAAHSGVLLSVAEALATMDVLAALAEVAHTQGWVAPVVRAQGALKIVGGKHPVVARHTPSFVPNDCSLNSGDLWLLTGPNMAGKSTFLRQVALLVVLAQVGSFVPAASMELGVVDQIFCRLGSSDHLAAGQSTFMVEMVETAQILGQATPQSLVILDELGRGTATYDGLAIAWACVEDLVGRVRSKTLLATHYHELTALDGANPGGLAGVSAHQVLVKEWQGQMVFVHQVVPGAAGKSYGVQVAKLAGVPPPVVKRAQTLLDGFVKSGQGRGGVVRVDELSLFAAPVLASAADPTPVTPVVHPVVAELEGLDVDSLSPKAALERLYQLKSMMR